MATKKAYRAEGGKLVEIDKTTRQPIAAATAPAPLPTPPENAPATTELSTPATAPTGIQAPALPTPSAPAVHDSFVTSLSEQAKLTRGAVETAYKTQYDRLGGEIEQHNANIKELQGKQEGVLENDVQPLLQPFREKLEKSERERLSVEDNYFANQKLVDELDSLLTEGNALIDRTRSQPISMQALDKRVSKTMQDVAARAGVIQAVMAARSGQIAEASRLIDRSVDAINADRKDQLSYYTTLLEFYENTKTEEGKKVAELSKDQKSFLTAQIGLLEGDMQRADENAQAIKQAMLDPDLAQVYGQAGVTLNDSPEEIGQKLAEYGYQREVRELSNEMAASGFSFLAPGQPAPSGAQVVTLTDSKGGQRNYYKSAAGGAGGLSTSQLFSFTNSIADDVRQDPDIKEFIIARDGFERVQTGANLDNAQGDLSLLFGYMKILDPNSVVRETEFANAEQAQGALQQVMNFPSKFLKGNRLTPEARQHFANAARSLYETKKVNYDNAVEYYSGRAQSFGIDPNMVLRDFSSQVPAQAGNDTSDQALMAEYVRMGGQLPAGPMSAVPSAPASPGTFKSDGYDSEGFFSNAFTSVFNMFAPK